MARVSELCFDIDGGQIVLKEDNILEFNDVFRVTIEELEFVVKQSHAFIKKREKVNSNAPNEEVIP